MPAAVDEVAIGDGQRGSAPGQGLVRPGRVVLWRERKHHIGVVNLLCGFVHGGYPRVTRPWIAVIPPSPRAGLATRASSPACCPSAGWTVHHGRDAAHALRQCRAARGRHRCSSTTCPAALELLDRVKQRSRAVAHRASCSSATSSTSRASSRRWSAAPPTSCARRWTRRRRSPAPPPPRAPRRSSRSSPTQRRPPRGARALRRADRPAQPPGDHARARDAGGHRPPPRSPAVGADDRRRPLQVDQRHARPPRRGRGAARDRQADGPAPARRGRRGPARRRRGPDPAARDGRPGRHDACRLHPRRHRRRAPSALRPAPCPSR